VRVQTWSQSVMSAPTYAILPGGTGRWRCLVRLPDGRREVHVFATKSDAMAFGEALVLAARLGLEP